LPALTSLVATAVAILAFLRTGRDRRKEEFKETLKNLLGTDEAVSKQVSRAVHQHIIDCDASGEQFCRTLNSIALRILGKQCIFLQADLGFFHTSAAKPGNESGSPPALIAAIPPETKPP
jgi:hypothetical protein